MSKQRFEKYISKELSTISKIWYQKNMVQPFAFHQSVGDFIILTEKNNFVLECKEIKNIDGKGAFSLNRLTQLNDLINFERKLYRNIGLVGLLYWGGTLKKSSIYIIPISVYVEFINNYKKQSLKDSDCSVLFPNFKLENITLLSIQLENKGEKYANKTWIQ